MHPQQILDEGAVNNKKYYFPIFTNFTLQIPKRQEILLYKSPKDGGTKAPPTPPVPPPPVKTSVGCVWKDYKGCSVQLLPVWDILYYHFQKRPDDTQIGIPYRRKQNGAVLISVQGFLVKILLNKMLKTDRFY